jgi:hypothetical protein
VTSGARSYLSLPLDASKQIDIESDPSSTSFFTRVVFIIFFIIFLLQDWTVLWDIFQSEESSKPVEDVNVEKKDPSEDTPSASEKDEPKESAQTSDAVNKGEKPDEDPIWAEEDDDIWAEEDDDIQTSFEPASDDVEDESVNKSVVNQASKRFREGEGSSRNPSPDYSDACAKGHIIAGEQVSPPESPRSSGYSDSETIIGGEEVSPPSSRSRSDYSDSETIIGGEEVSAPASPHTQQQGSLQSHRLEYSDSDSEIGEVTIVKSDQQKDDDALAQIVLDLPKQHEAQPSLKEVLARLLKR